MDFTTLVNAAIAARNVKNAASGIQEFTKGVVVKRRKADEDKAINEFAKEQAAADADPDVAAMEERGGMEGLDFRKMGERGLAASRGKEYADEVKGQEEFDELDLGADFSKGLKPTGNALSVEPVVDAKASTKPIGNTPTEIGSDTKDPYRVSAKDPEVTGADFSAGVNATGNALSVEPVEDAKAPTKPLGNVPTDLLSGEDIARRADVPEDTLAALFKKTHGGPFDPKSKMDKAKMATITSMIEENRDLLNLSPTQFALKVYARKK